MNKQNTFHVQCHLVRDNVHYTAWIPEEFARVGRTIRILRDDAWEDGWHVKERGTRLPTQYVFEHERNFLSQREASDV